MTEQLSPQLTADEAIQRIAADIKAFPKDGPNKREEHLRLYSALVAPDEINALWAERYAEIARAQGRRWPPQRQSFSLPAPQPTAEEKPKATALSVPVAERAEGAVEVLDPSNPLAVAKRFIAVRGQYNGTRIIHRWRGKFWNWRDNHYRPTDDDAIRAALYNFLSAADIEVRFGKCSAFTALKPNKTMVNNIFDALEAVALVDQEYEMPSWFGASGVFGEDRVNSNELVAMRNGLLYLPTRKLISHSPDFFSANISATTPTPNARGSDNSFANSGRATSKPNA